MNAAPAQSVSDTLSLSDTRSFRTALGSFVTGVTIVTTRDTEGSDVGLTANSFNSVSLEPPMVLWSLALNSTHLPAFRAATWWAVHVLASSQETLSGLFATKGADKFVGLSVARGPGDIPLLEGCAARFICRTAFEYEGGDHAIFVGEVSSFDRAGHRPLVYHQGRYGRVHPGDDAGADAAFLGLTMEQNGQRRLTDSGTALLMELMSVAAASGDGEALLRRLKEV